GKQGGPIPVDELDGGVLQRDDEVESDVPVLHAQEVCKPDLVRGVWEPRHVDELRVVVEVPPEADIEDAWQLAFTDGRELGIPPRRVENENLLVGVLRNGETTRRQF